jgi:TetR/AcrR family transcriptional regulator, cholesterol catabolism regulator
MRDSEFAWATFLARGMEQGVIPEADPRLLTRAVLGLYNSVWHWYRPRGHLTLAEVGDFYIRRCLAVLGVPHEFVDDATAGARRDGAGSRKKARGAQARTGSR